MRTDGLQEFLLKDPTILNNNDRITKMRTAIQAVSIAARSVFQQSVHRSMTPPPPQLFQWKSSPNPKPLASFYVKFMGQEIAFANIDKSLVEQVIQVSVKDEFLSLLLHDETVMTDFTHQLPSGQSVRTISNNIVTKMVSGISVNIVKPLLVSEVRRIVPTAVGLPLELSLLTAAVAGASVRGGQKL